MLRAKQRDLRTEAGEHYADILLSLYQRQLKELHEEQETNRAEAEAVQKAAAATRSDQQSDQVEARAREISGATNEPGQSVGQVNGGQVQRESAQPASAAASSYGQHHATAVGPIDKSALPISAPRRVRDKDHLRFVASQPCLICGRSPGHAHHVRYAQPRAMGRKR